MNESLPEGQDRRGIVSPAFKHFVIELITFGIVGTGIWVVGESLENHGHQKVGVWVNFFAAMAFFAVIPERAFKRWRSKAKRFWISVGYAAFVLVGAFAWGHLMFEPDPKLVLSLSSDGSEAANTDILLTNSFLFREPGTIRWETAGGRIVIPVNPSGRGSLHLGVRSDSVCSEATIAVAISTNIACEPRSDLESQWFPGRFANSVGLRVWGFRTPPFLPDSGHAAPDLIFPNCSNIFGSAFKLSISVESKEVRRFGIVCGVTFVPTNDMPRVIWSPQTPLR